jgi:hypothetical protein
LLLLLLFAAELVIQESVLTYSIKKDFHTKGVDEEVEEERKKRNCM